MSKKVLRCAYRSGRAVHAKHFVWFALTLYCWLPKVSMANEQPCRQMVKAQKYKQAAQCYRNLYRQVDRHPNWRKDAPLYKDRFLRHAALCYHLSAKAQTRPDIKGYLLEQAIDVLRISFQKGYCEASQRCRSNRLLTDQWKQEIGYAPLSVVTNARSAKIIIEGYQFREERYQHLTRKVRPGQYQLTIIHPQRGTQKRSIEVRPNHTLSINASRATIRIIEKRIFIAKKIPPLVLVGYIGGGVLAAVGAVMLTVAVIEQNNLNSVWQNPERNKELTEEMYNNQFRNAETIKIVGGVVGGLGILLLAGGAIAHFAANASTPKQRTELRPGSVLQEAPPPTRGQGLLLVAH